ncbi:TRAP transporter small permease [Treponema parvum]|uniref:TRAP transporter small permease n=1 Tax=Treponema parvum TaxID=138851 RepID=A0A975EY96_9SPIR|nr:TRAP transporter small permease [Treponema parvum]QTQ11002.1 TRAP transporter small permease [Treponema parvum]QTQ14833.1 TRAP transporter small permease [Treponema parvum]QTQ17052.1 TRAP transporter small permease [Treponema parvum]
MSDKKQANAKSILRYVDIYISSAALIVLIAITFLGVIARYCIGSPFGWTEEMQAFLIVWVVFSAAGAAFRTGNHSAIDIVYVSVPKKAHKVLDVLIAVISILVLCYLAYTTVIYLNLFMATGRKTSVLQIPYIFIYSIVLLSCVLQIINFVMVNILGKWDESVDLIEENKLTGSEFSGTDDK